MQKKLWNRLNVHNIEVIIDYGDHLNIPSSGCTVHDESHDSQQSRSRINRQPSQGQLKRQESGY
jgi:hypothetical protein